jgi:hypothetical protein
MIGASVVVQVRKVLTLQEERTYRRRTDPSRRPGP